MKSYKIRVPSDRDKKYTMFKYPAGELQVRIKPEEFIAVASADSIEVTARLTDGEIMELALLASAIGGLKKKGAKVTLILPYLPYARADRRFVKGDCQGLRVFSLMLKALGFDEIETFDVHSPTAQRLIPILVNNPPDEYVKLAVKDIGTNDLTVLLPDKGAARYEEFVKTLHVDYGFGEKVRDAATGALSGFTVPEGLKDSPKVLIIDDICDGGGTFIGLAKAVKEKNPTARLFLFVTHGIFSKGLEELQKHFEQIYSTGTFPTEYLRNENRLY